MRKCNHGLGLFALRRYRRGEIIEKCYGVRLVAETSSKGRALRIGESEYWDEEPPSSIYYWSNFVDHSFDNNSVFVFARALGIAYFIATKDIAEGEEIFINYRDYYPTNPVFF